MDFLTDLTNILTSINFEGIFKLIALAAVVLSGPIVIVLLSFRGGDL
jgi:hypothetical protein